MPLFSRQPDLGPVTPSRRELRRRRILRRLAAAALMGCATWLTLSLLGVGSSGANGGDPVLVAASDLSAGHRLGPADTTTIHVPAQLIPDAVKQVDENTLSQGRILTAPLSAGEFISTTRLRPVNVSDGLPAGVRAVVVPLRDNTTAALLNPGSRVDVHSGSKGGVVVADVQVLQITTPNAEQGSFGAVNSTETTAVVLAVPVNAADPLMAALSSGSVEGGAVNLALRAT